MAHRLRVPFNTCYSSIVLNRVWKMETCRTSGLFSVASERIWKWGGGHRFVVQVQRVVLVSAFVLVSTVWSVSCLLFLYSRCSPRAQPFVKVGGTCPLALWSRRHWSYCSVPIFYEIHTNCPWFCYWISRSVHFMCGQLSACALVCFQLFLFCFYCFSIVHPPVYIFTLLSIAVHIL